MAIGIDLIDGNTAQQTETGWQLDRIAIVTGISGIDGYFKNIAAITQSGLPQVGAPHPAIPTAILRNVTAVSITSEEVKMRLFYSESFDTVPTINLGATSVQVETNQGRLVKTVGTSAGDVDIIEENESDIVAQKITTTAAAGPGDPTTTTTEETGVLVNRFAPENTIVYTRVEYVAAGTIVDNAQKFVGTTNLPNWSVREFDRERTWLCTGITGASSDNGISWNVTFSFQYRADTWDSEVVWLEDNGRPLPKTSLEQGEIGSASPVRRYAVHKSEDFNLLGLA